MLFLPGLELNPEGSRRGATGGQVDGELKHATACGPPVEPGAGQLPGLFPDAPLQAAHLAAVPGMIGESCRSEASSLPEHRATCFEAEFLSLA